MRPYDTTLRAPGQQFFGGNHPGFAIGVSSGPFGNSWRGESSSSSFSFSFSKTPKNRGRELGSARALACWFRRLAETIPHSLSAIASATAEAFAMTLAFGLWPLPWPSSILYLPSSLICLPPSLSAIAPATADALRPFLSLVTRLTCHIHGARPTKGPRNGPEARLAAVIGALPDGQIVIPLGSACMRMPPRPFTSGGDPSIDGTS